MDLRGHKLALCDNLCLNVDSFKVSASQDRTLCKSVQVGGQTKRQLNANLELAQTRPAAQFCQVCTHIFKQVRILCHFLFVLFNYGIRMRYAQIEVIE